MEEGMKEHVILMALGMFILAVGIVGGLLIGTIDDGLREKNEPPVNIAQPKLFSPDDLKPSERGEHMAFFFDLTANGTPLGGTLKVGRVVVADGETTADLMELTLTWDGEVITYFVVGENGRKYTSDNNDKVLEIIKSDAWQKSVAAWSMGIIDGARKISEEVAEAKMGAMEEANVAPETLGATVAAPVDLGDGS